MGCVDSENSLAVPVILDVGSLGVALVAESLAFQMAEPVDLEDGSLVAHMAENAGPGPMVESAVQVTVSEDQVVGKVEPVTENDRSSLASGIYCGFPLSMGRDWRLPGPWAVKQPA